MRNIILYNATVKVRLIKSDNNQRVLPKFTVHSQRGLKPFVGLSRFAAESLILSKIKYFLSNRHR
jgi:hypothetical protein